MKSIKNYMSSLVLLASVIVGGLIGAFLPGVVPILKPVGSLFINYMFVIIVPLVFFSICSAIITTSEGKRLGKILGSTFLVFIVTATIAAVLSYIVSVAMGLNANTNVAPATDEIAEATAIGDLIVNAFSTNDFLSLFSRSNLIPLILFSFLLGLAINAMGDSARPLRSFIKSGAEVVMKMVDMLMKLAPIGLSCYFAVAINDFGSQIVSGYVMTFVIYMIVSAIYYFGFFTLYAFFSAGTDGIKVFWKNAVPPSLMAISTASSAACMPINLLTSKQIGISSDVAETVIPLGANTHKDGSVIGAVMKILFLFSFYGKEINGVGSAIAIIGAAILSAVLIGAIPSGGLSGEVLMVALFGFPAEAVAIIAIISVIIDIPATLLNSTGNIVCAMMVNKFTDSKNWLKNHIASGLKESA